MAIGEQWEGGQSMDGAAVTARLRATVQAHPISCALGSLSVLLTFVGMFLPMAYVGPALMAAVASVASGQVAIESTGKRRGVYGMLAAVCALSVVALCGYAASSAFLGDVANHFKVWSLFAILVTSVLGVSLTRLMSARMTHSQRRALDAASMSYGGAGCGLSLIFQLDEYGTPFFGRTPINVSWLVSHLVTLCSTGFLLVIVAVCLVYPRHRSSVTSPIAMGVMLWFVVTAACVGLGVVSLQQGDALVVSATVFVFVGVLFSAWSHHSVTVVDPLRSRHPYLPISCLVASGIVSTIQRRNTPQHDDALTFLMCLVLVFIIVRSYMMTELLSGLVSRLESQEEQLTFQANVDELSGLANRRNFYAVLEGELRQSAHDVTVAYIDLDGFKGINDSYGHAVGDNVLRHISQSLKASLPEAVCVARIAGDEFAVVYKGPRSVDEWASDALDSLCAPYIHDGRSISLTGSLGVATHVVGQEAPTVDELMHRADVCLYRAKDSGRNRYVVYGDPPANTPTTNCGHL